MHCLCLSLSLILLLLVEDCLPERDVCELLHRALELCVVATVTGRSKEEVLTITKNVCTTTCTNYERVQVNPAEQIHTELHLLVERGVNQTKCNVQKDSSSIYYLIYT